MQHLLHDYGQLSYKASKASNKTSEPQLIKKRHDDRTNRHNEFGGFLYVGLFLKLPLVTH